MVHWDVIISIALFSVMIVCLAIVIVGAIMESKAVGKIEEQAIRLGYAKRIYDKDNYGKFVWIEPER